MAISYLDLVDLKCSDIENFYQFFKLLIEDLLPLVWSKIKCFNSKEIVKGLSGHHILGTLLMLVSITVSNETNTYF